MKTYGSSTGAWLLVGLCVAVAGCGSTAKDSDDDDDNGKTAGSGGTKAAGGATGSGGTGAAAGSGGTSGSAGSTDACSQSCEGDGFATGTSSNGSCTCDTPTDTTCTQAMEAFCVCLASLEPPPCTDQDRFNDYVECHTNRDGLRSRFLCVNNYVQGTQVDCNGASSACF